MARTLFFAGALLLGWASAQSSTSTAVPSTTPLPGDYSGYLRPQIHYSPPVNFMNDPNGMFVDAQGIWHLYYQYNPTSTVAGNQHWGHATSKDLYHWDNQKIAIFPSKTGDGIFSGSCVIDSNNTSGFFPSQNNGVVAIYTLNTAREQTQEIAYSTDGGYTFIKYAQNPVISINSTQFRDPKVIWHAPTSKWVAVLAYAVDFAIGIYTSPDLKNWTFTSNFSHHGLLGLQYECPNLQEIPMVSGDPTWVMTISINPGAPLGGSIMQYFPGSFNGTHFTAVDSAARIADFGKDNYAGQFFHGTPEGSDAISMAWASNWQYSQTVPTGEKEGWRSAMSLPRRNRLKNITRIGYTLVSEPYDLTPLYDMPLANAVKVINNSATIDYSKVVSGALYFEVNVTGIPSANITDGTANFTFYSSVSGESIRGGFYFGGDVPFWINRGNLNGFDNPFFTDKMSTNNLLSTSTWRMSGVIDRSILEIFLDGGDRSATNTFFPEYSIDTMTFGTRALPAGMDVTLTVWSLKSAWGAKGSSNGTVAGNSTMKAKRSMRIDSELF
ncbi:MAG: hypothetical protein M1814_002343 [Vezdaea aestivalis]|nr:MAG: hypothetical protein M1814_002343 [Vezdaea aestivalis]